MVVVVMIVIVLTDRVTKYACGGCTRDGCTGIDRLHRTSVGVISGHATRTEEGGEDDRADQENVFCMGHAIRTGG